ncbi:hypothetical protein EHS25_003927 [Saitozyma podzolica]|uniref:Major facilitator superfamily (MFS) profile domain-containing protein n=1 Tax=Saitozyma podzolica TaxID=1890683 RepID=A0A427Y3W7_9TREE|nr:hypothetical protein EHS25_003927 [Saitozyma podzolica]
MTAHSNEKDLEIVHDQVADKLGAVQLEQVDKVITATEWQQLLNDAQAAEEEEKNMPLKEAFRIYPMAMFWTFAVTVSFIMAAFDQSIFGSIIALPAFRQKYGFYGGQAAGYQFWQTGLSKAAGTGSFIGILISSWAQARYGYRRTLQVGLVWLSGCIFITFFAQNITMLFIGELLCGLPFGAFTTTAMGYASEIAPVPLRGFLTTYIALVNSFGQLLSAGVFKGMANLTGEWSYRIPFAVQWVWIIPLFIIATFAPESPWFLVRSGKLKEAERAVARLGKKADERDPARIVAMMVGTGFPRSSVLIGQVRTNEHEKERSESLSYVECFKGTNLRRTEIACMTMCFIPLCGDWFGGGGAYFFEQAGLNTSDAFSFNMGLWGFACFGTIGSWFIIPYVGRRKLMMSGLSALAGLLFLVGLLTIPVRQGNSAAKWAQAALILVWIFVFNISVAPLVYVIVGECSSTRLRGQTIGIARNVYILCALPVAFIASYSMNPTAWGWGTYAGLFWVSFIETVDTSSYVDRAVWNLLAVPAMGVLPSP